MIAQTILQQIGGRRFAAITGSRNFSDLGNGLLMSLAKNMTSANRLEIIYDEGQTYTICVSTARHSAKRHSIARRKTSPNTRVCISICWNISLRKLRDLIHGFKGWRHPPLLSFSEQEGGQRK